MSLLVLSGGGWSPATAQSAPQARVVDFNIAPQPLASALTAFADRAGLKLLFQTGRAANVESRGLKGRFTPQEAAARLLAGSGLSYRFTNPTTLTVGSVGPATGSVPADGATQLIPITVEGEGSAWGPVDGIVARQSATGTKTATPLVETPESIHVVAREQLRDQAVTTLGQALRYSPGVVAEELGGTDNRYDQYMIRGFSDTYPYVDSLSTRTYFTLLSPKLEPYGLEKVEVLNGPASSLYGAGTPGGLVDAISKRPTDTPSHELQLQVGDPKGVSGAFDFSGPVTDDGAFLYRLTGIARAADTQVDYVDTRNFYIAPAFTWKPDEDTSFTLLTKFQRTDDGILTQNLPAIGTLYEAPFGKIPTDFFVGEPDFNKLTKNSASVGYAFEHRFDDVWTVRQNFRYSSTSTKMNLIGTAGWASATELNRWTMDADADLRDFAVDTQAEAKFDTGALDHTLLLGVDHMQSKSHWYDQEGDAATLDVLNPVYGLPYTTDGYFFETKDRLRQTGVYVQDQVSFDNWRISGGLRYDWATTKDSMTLPSSETIINDDKHLTGRIGALYLFDNGLAPYVSYSTSFKPSPGLNATSNDPLKPTTGKQFEVGMKYQPNGYDSYFTVSLYNLEQDNVTTSDPSQVIPVFTQTGAVRMRGIELSGVADLDDGLKLIGSYSYNDGKITRDENPDTLGNRPLDVPRHMASLWVDKTIQSGAAEGLGFGAGVRYIGDRYGDNENATRLPSHVLVDASVHYDIKDWRLAVNATNLFDKTYVGSCDGENYCYYGNRRTVLGTVTYKW
ncbi:TonB-dependent siderophore receptor [Rhizobium sp. S152]|uniref:TonB-dependent siderophore receptor n=1 Tax=Rhizobium sp. S152 TaxID=3055038 RepID=UPI0025A99065|nr:TonB-dependent siderophore receptor [Rhizobium sp. S152]MDM9627703.1 TonB-dependent siderophore receptor [Rhizobium sp. S152]